MTPFAFFPMPFSDKRNKSDKAHRKKQSEGVVTYVELLLRSNAV